MRFESFNINTNENESVSDISHIQNIEIDDELLKKATKIVVSEITDPKNKTDNEIKIHNQLLNHCAMGDKNAQKQIKAMIKKIIEKNNRLGFLSLGNVPIKILVKKIYENNYGLGAIDFLINDKSISEIWVNGYDNIWIQKNGKAQRVLEKSFKDNEDVERIINLMLQYNHKDITKQKPMEEARMLDGSRLTVLIPPVSDRPCINIRKFDAFEVSTESLLKAKTINEEMETWTEKAVKGRSNILIIGETNSGKTSFLKWTIGLMNPKLRIGTIESNFELKLSKKYPNRNIFAYEEHPELGILMGDLFTKCLRSSPDVIICGEARGSEANELIKAMRRGHAGSESSIHTNSPETAVDDLGEMINEDGKRRDPILLRNRIANAIDLIYQIKRLDDGSRKVVKISEVVANNEDFTFEIKDIFKYEINKNNPSLGSFEKVGVITNNLKKKINFYGVPEEDLINM